MKQVLVNIPDKKFEFINELLNNFTYLEVEPYDPDSKKAILNNIKNGLREAKLLKEGKLKFRNAKDFLNEL